MFFIYYLLFIIVSSFIIFQLACRILLKCIQLRSKWQNHNPFPPQDLDVNDDSETLSKQSSSPGGKSGHRKHFRRRLDPEYDIFGKPVPNKIVNYNYRMIKGVINVFDGQSQSSDPLSDFGSSFITGEENNEERSLFPVPSFEEFVEDFLLIKKGAFTGQALSYSYKRLQLLLAKFDLHVLLNGEKESENQKTVPHRDFYNVRKVDTHVHHSAAMNQKHMLRFIKHKLKTRPDEVVIFRDDKYLTLGEVFKSLHLTAYDLSIDTLDMHAHNTFQRFDKFNLKYNPAGQSRLREIFLKTDNLIEGKYLAELTREMMNDLQANKYQLVEWRISIYGRKPNEWTKLAKWFYNNKLAHPNVRWVIQVPRLYKIYKEGKDIETFGELLNNIFAPLFAVTLNPQSDPALYYFLQTVVAFDSVDDESRPEFITIGADTVGSILNPNDWKLNENPPYNYWMYYMFANICTLNKLRASLGFRTFTFRPHCGEAGDIDRHFVNYLFANHINHGIVLKKNAVIHYLYYLSQVIK